jgi:hypothetical protein
MVTNPTFGNGNGIDFAGLNPNIVIDCGTGTQTGGYSTDNGLTWHPFASQAGGSKVAVSADGSTFVWDQNYSTSNGANWTACTGLPGGARICSDRVNPNKFYAFFGGTFYVSTNKAATFSAATTGLSGSGRAAAVFGMEGEVWVSAGNNLYHIKNSGTNSARVAAVQQVYSVGFGKADSGSTYPAVYIVGNVNNVYGVFRSNDQGATWTRVNDDQHQFGQMDNVAGDEDYYGRVYVTTQGRGIPYGEPVATSVVSSAPSSLRVSHQNCLVKQGTFIVAKGSFPAQLVDLRGRILRQAQSNGNESIINIKGLARGVYFVHCGDALLKVSVVE